VVPRIGLVLATQTYRGIVDDHPRSRPPVTALWGRAGGRLRYRRATPSPGT
jgi:hypothetical protein